MRLDGDLAGGALNDVGCYTVNAARMLFREEPLWASAQWVRSAQVDLSVSGVLGFSGDRMATIECSFRAAGKGSYSVMGTMGRIDSIDAFTPATMEDTTLVHMDSAGKLHWETIAGVDQYRLEAEEFADALLARRPVRIPPSDAVANMRAIDALKRSAADGGIRAVVADV